MWCYFGAPHWKTFKLRVIKGGGAHTPEVWLVLRRTVNWVAIALESNIRSGEAKPCFVFVQCLTIFSSVMDSAKPKTHFLSTSLYFSAHMYFERSLIHMFLIYLHASHQNAVLYELFDVQEACWAFPLRFPRPHPQGSGSYDLQKRKEKNSSEPPIFFPQRFKFCSKGGWHQVWVWFCSWQSVFSCS